MSIRAVVFDLGGVVLGSPLHAIAAYERAQGIPANFVNRVVAQTAPHGAWSRLERGEIDMARFVETFEEECAQAGARVDARAMFDAMGRAAAPRPEMLTAIERIRGRGMLTAALTNNWATDAPAKDASPTDALGDAFDVFVESRVVGLRKPDPAIYRLVCERMEVAPADAAFLDDIGANLKPARALGMTTIRVIEPLAALRELEAVVGFPLLDDAVEA
jgi:putative hydrolase of the HAD superfamily